MSENLSTILVTGATGTGGSEVVKQLSSITPAIKIKAGSHSFDRKFKESEGR